MINRGGENVYSIEVESALAGAPGVGEAAVVAVPDEMMGEKVGAVIVPAAEATSTSRRWSRTSRERIADFKVPQYVAVRSEPLPRNPGGKVLKAAAARRDRLGRAAALNRPLLGRLLKRRAHHRLRGVAVRRRECLDQVAFAADEHPAEVGELAEALDAVMATRAALSDAAEWERRQSAVHRGCVHARPADVVRRSTSSATCSSFENT